MKHWIKSTLDLDLLGFAANANAISTLDSVSASNTLHQRPQVVKLQHCSSTRDSLDIWAKIAALFSPCSYWLHNVGIYSGQLDTDRNIWWYDLFIFCLNGSVVHHRFLNHILTWNPVVSWILQVHSASAAVSSLLVVLSGVGGGLGYLRLKSQHFGRACALNRQFAASLRL